MIYKLYRKMNKKFKEITTVDSIPEAKLKAKQTKITGNYIIMNGDNKIVERFYVGLSEHKEFLVYK